MQEIVSHPIGTIRTPFDEVEGMPIQPIGVASAKGRVIVDPVFAEGLNDIDGFSHLILIYHLHKSKGYNLTVKPFLDDQPRGLFATRAPRRPNSLGFSIVSLVRREDNVLHVQDIDVVDHTPLLDIKPYVPAFDAPNAASIGWLEGKIENSRTMQSDGRFKGRGNE